MTDPVVCCARWSAPRVDTFRGFMVGHACKLRIGHDGLCACSCGAEALIGKDVRSCRL